MADKIASPAVIAGFLTAATASVFGQGLNTDIPNALPNLGSVVPSASSPASNIASAIDTDVGSILGGGFNATKGISGVFNQMAPLPTLNMAIGAPTLPPLGADISQALSGGTSGISNTIGDAVESAVPSVSNALSATNPALKSNILGR